MNQSIQSIARVAALALGRGSWLSRTIRPAYDSWLSWSSGGRGIPRRVNDVLFRVDPRYRNYVEPNHEPEVAGFLREHVRSGAVCFDIGANVGVYALQFAHWSAPDGLVVAFEPSPDAFDGLESHILLNDLTGRVRPVRAGVASEVGEARLWATGLQGQSRIGSPDPVLADRAHVVTIPVTTIDQFCLDEKLEPDWLLVDVEGFEFAVLRGAAQTVRRRKGALGIVVEMHPYAWASMGETRETVERTLADLGLRMVPLGEQRYPLAEFGHVYLVPV